MVVLYDHEYDMKELLLRVLQIGPTTRSLKRKEYFSELVYHAPLLLLNELLYIYMFSCK